MISFAWQNLTAIDLLKCLFEITHQKNETLSFEGYSYLNLEYDQNNLINDLNEFLTKKERKVVKVTLSERQKRPREGYYHQKNDQ